MAIESLSKRSKEGRYPNHAAGGGQRVDRNAKADANLGMCHLCIICEYIVYNVN